MTHEVSIDGLCPSLIYINGIACVCVCVCVCVCPFAGYLLLGKWINIDKLYMDRSRIYLGRILSIWEVDPTIFPDSTVRKPDTIGAKPAKIAIFRHFSIKFRALKGRYQLDILMQGRGAWGTYFGSFLSNFTHFKSPVFKKNRPKIAENSLKSQKKWCLRIATYRAKRDR